jgi:guanylate kinase
MTVAGRLYIVAAPSGAGKTSLVARMVETTPGIEASVSHTTRPPRPHEQEGVHYYFVDVETFQGLIGQQAFLEYAQVFDNFYGTSRDAVVTRLRMGMDVILEIDWQGARQVSQLMPESRSIFVLPPSLDSLRRRLEGRGQDSDEVIERRMREAVHDMSHYHEFDYVVINDDFQLALEALNSIIIANRQLREVQVLRHGALISSLLS